MGQFFPKPHKRSGGNVNAELDLSNYPTKADVKILVSKVSQVRY